MQVEVKSLSKSIKGIPVLSDVSCSFEGGHIYGLRGRNGSGKTMLLRAIAGLILPTSGCVSVNGEVLGKDRSFPESLGLLIETPAFIDKYTGFKNLEMIASLKGVCECKDIEEAIERVGLDPADRRHYRKYSLGMKQRLGIACSIMERPELLLLDEPFNALDPSGVERVEHIAKEEKERGSLVIIACHDDEILRDICDEIITLAEGRIVSGKRANNDS